VTCFPVHPFIHIVLFLISIRLVVALPPRYFFTGKVASVRLSGSHSLSPFLVSPCTRDLLRLPPFPLSVWPYDLAHRLLAPPSPQAFRPWSLCYVSPGAGRTLFLRLFPPPCFAEPVLPMSGQRTTPSPPFLVSFSSIHDYASFRSIQLRTSNVFFTVRLPTRLVPLFVDVSYPSE